MSRNLTLEINHDSDTDQPDAGYEGWRLVSFGRVNYEDPEKFVKAFNQRTGEVTPANVGLRRKLEVGLAFFLAYYEHGLSRWSLKGEGPQCPWDSVPLAGILIWTGKPADIGPRTLEDRAEDARNFLESFNDWANGNCFWIRLSDENGEEIESFGGLNGVDAVSAFVSDELRAGDSVRIIGDAAWLKNHLHLPEGVTVVEEFSEPTAA